MAKTAARADAKAIYVRFFGTFQVDVGGRALNESTSRARKPWSLLQYLMVYRNKKVTRQQLMDALWPEGGSDQPEKALKNLVYRVRSAFAALDETFTQDVILYVNGNYQLNNQLVWRLDFEDFERLRALAVKADTPGERSVECAMKAIELYHGDFLADQVYEDWVLPLNTHYRSLFFECVYRALDLLEAAGRDSEIEQVCSRALAIDQFEEELHLAYMNALVRQEKKSVALAHYNKMADLFFREMGVAPGEELRQLYQKLSQELNRTDTDLVAIKEALAERTVDNSAFYCDFEVFRNLYRLEARAAERAGQAVFVGLLSLSRTDEQPLAGEELSTAMATLLTAIHQSLRRGDVVSRFSLSQYILLLPTITVENAEKVLHRVVERYNKLATQPQVTVTGRVQPLDPVIL